MGILFRNGKKVCKGNRVSWRESETMVILPDSAVKTATAYSKSKNHRIHACLTHFNLILMKMKAEILYLSSEMLEYIIPLYKLKIKYEDIYDGNKTLFPV